jgi:hypothetical protein
LGLWGLVLILHLLVILAYHAGKLDSHFATRLGLPIHLILVLAPVWVLVKEKLSPRFWNTLLVGSVIFLTTISASRSSQAIFTKKNFYEREFRWAKALLDEQAESSYLVLDSRLSHWLSYKKQGMHINQSSLLKDASGTTFLHANIQDVFVIQRIEMDPASERLSIISGDELPDFELELVDEYISRPFFGVRLSRIIK